MRHDGEDIDKEKDIIIEREIKIETKISGLSSQSTTGLEKVDNEA